MPLKETFNVTVPEKREAQLTTQDGRGRHQCRGQKGAGGEALATASAKWARQGKVDSLGLASWSHSGRFWDMGTVPSYLTPDPGLILGEGKYWFVE